MYHCHMALQTKWLWRSSWEGLLCQRPPDIAGALLQEVHCANALAMTEKNSVKKKPAVKDRKSYLAECSFYSRQYKF